MKKSCKNITACNAPAIKRLGAFLIDCLIVGFFTRIAMIFNTFLPIVVSALYFSLMESSSKGATLGKQAFHIKVVDSKNDERIRFLRALIRHFIKMISVLFCGVGYFSLIIGRENEKIA